MKKERKTVVYDDKLRMEAYRFEGIMQPFPNHFHEYYVIGFVEDGQRVLSCKNKEYSIEKGNVILFNPGDNHACVQSDDCTFDYRGFNISKSIMLDLVEEVTGKRELPGFSKSVIYNEEITCYLRPLHEMVMNGSSDFGKEESLLLLISALIQNYGQPFENCVPECRQEIEKACEFIRQHFNERIYLDQICRYAGLSKEKLRMQFFIGFVVAMVGIILISFNGSKLQLNPVGDLLAIAAALVWACYSILTRKISSFGYHVILSTRKTFFYGILFMIPTLFLMDFQPDLSRLANMTYLFNILYLGLGASALCFVTWNFAVKELGSVKASVYIYMVPVITVITSVLILQEQLTILAGIGTILTLIGLFLSEHKTERKYPASKGTHQKDQERVN